MLVLIGIEGVGRLLVDPCGCLVIMLGRSRFCGCGNDDDVRTHAFEIADLLDRALVGQNKDTFITANGSGQRETDSGVAARRLDDGAAFFRTPSFSARRSSKRRCGPD